MQGFVALNANNRHANIVLVCQKCGKLYQPIAGAALRRCICGGKLVVREKT
jgi:DNA-directed RNA polymerase subunit RPC12/RpoP